MISEKDYCELEKRFLKLKNDYDNSYSNHIDIERSLNKSYNDALNDRNKCKFEFYDLKEKYDGLKLRYDILFNDSNDAKWLERMKISDIEKYIRKKKMEKLSNEKKY